MKKNKSTESTSAHFNNNPFKSLKRVKSTASAAPAAKPATPARNEKQEDEIDLFLRAVSGVRAIDSGSGNPSETKKNQIAEASRGEDRDDRQLFLQAMQKIGTTLRKAHPEADIDEAPRQPASSRMKQLKRGTIRIREELDLHGNTKDEALVKLSHFIAAAYSRGQQAVLIITGKGINSPEGPVLQGAVAEWLRGKGKGMVAEFAPAPRTMGGSGAFVVFLKNR